MHPTAARSARLSLALILAVGAAPAPTAAAFMYEGFSGYPIGDSIGGQDGGTGWGDPWWSGGLTVAAQTPAYWSP